MEPGQQQTVHNKRWHTAERAFWSVIAVGYLAIAGSFAKGAIDIYHDENRLEEAGITIDIDRSRNLELWGELGAVGTFLASGLAAAGAVYTPLSKERADEE